ncbi:hypothetical protein Ahy_B05g074413 [Arachis hypogaea]|uniref:coproporphyrinogen oxidase n=1 Tax=Arachis hypogaea TaxID=3818 RepID=A0A444YZ44_ARAHY|nr:hypothetical protein Ahy_B05g074413 [Arachis hypogaea]
MGQELTWCTFVNLRDQLCLRFLATVSSVFRSDMNRSAASASHRWLQSTDLQHLQSNNIPLLTQDYNFYGRELKNEEECIGMLIDPVCTALEAADGMANFKDDVWSRPSGGGGISRVLQDGAIWEKAGVNVSVVYEIMPPEAYRAAKAAASPDQKPGPIPFFAAGISSVNRMGNDINLFQVLHPKNPFAPTLQIMIFHPYFGAVSHTIIAIVDMLTLGLTISGNNKLEGSIPRKSGKAFSKIQIRPLSNPNRCSWGELKKEEAIYFQIRRMWLRDSECKEIIKRSWVVNYDQIEEKLGKCNKALQEWRLSWRTSLERIRWNQKIYPEL